MTTTEHATDTTTSHQQAAIKLDGDVPAVHIWRDFRAPLAAVVQAHTDPNLFAKWIGPEALSTRIDHWDCRTLGSYRYVNIDGDTEYAFRGTFPEVGPDRIVQTFCYEPMPEAIALETLTFTDLGDGRTRLHGFSLCDSFESRDGMVASGMEVGIHEGYAALDRLLAEGSGS